MDMYTVWVGGTEVTDWALDLREAQEIAEKYRDDGYDDVAVEELEFTVEF